ncbi:cytochrome c biogenesis CcdA family protein [Mycobacterium sp. E740]|uniref:cytochrome c biogenesis CcdA family protein n=1 Tax=Mycobacterium sp. E740 TaxID=1834149 RepID=UPI0007FC5C24|nr:cytochrome c biogenesis CcdA family protein [Mycobacterium sp. E740]OBI74025.1 cytochrome C biogenesis protein ResC [Mycobacterium sp. E740]
MSLNQVDQLVAGGPVLLALLVSALAGLVSFASPCVVPLVPGYLSYLAAVVGVDADDAPNLVRRHRRSGEESREESAKTSVSTGAATRGAARTTRLRVAGAAALFVAGFTVVFVLGTVAVLGMTTSLITNQLLLQRIGGVLTIVMGLVFVGFIPVLQREARFTPRQISTLGGAPLLGAVFALGWTPCLGPTLTGVIAVASATDGSNVARGVALVVAYCLGLGIPFLLLAFGSARAVQGLAWLRTHSRTIQIFGGVLLILVGAALVTGVWNDFVSWVRDAFVSDVTLPI